MKYYAVTDDPNELMHYGILGMKWGVIRTPEQLGHRKPPKTTSINPKKVQSMLTEYRKGLNSKQISKSSYNAPKAQKNLKSPAYINASSKLRKMMKSGIDKAHASWENYNSPSNVAARRYKKNEKLFEKHVQLARQGRLKYKGISDDEVVRIADRLDLERQARQLSGAEKPSFARRLITSAGEGIISGVGQGMATRTSERIGRGAKLKTQRKMQEQSAEFARKKAREEEKRELKKEYQKTMAENGHSIRANMPTLLRSTKYKRIAEVKDNAENRKKNEEEYAKLATENRLLDYSSVYGDDSKRFRFDPSNVHRLSDTELSARVSLLKDAKKLYNTSEEQAIKKNNGIVTKTKKNEDGSEETIEEFDPNAYSNNRPSADSARVTPHRSGNTGSSRVSANRRMFDDYADQEEAQYNRAAKSARRAAKRAAKIQDRKDRAEFEEQRKQAAQAREERIRKHNEREKAKAEAEKAAERAKLEAADAAERERFRANVRAEAERVERERARAAQKAEAQRIIKTREQGYRDREERLRYRENVSRLAEETDAARRINSARASGRTARIERFGNVQNIQQPLFIDESRYSDYDYTPRPASYTVTRKPRRRTR